MPRLKRPPGPRRWSPFGSLVDLRVSPIETLMKARATYGDVVRFRVGLWSAFLLSHPADVKHVLQDNYQNYRKGFSFEYLKPLVGRGLLTADGDEWLDQRRLVQPAFHHERLDRLVGDIAASAEALASSWSARAETGSVDVLEEMTGLTMEIVSRTMLGVDLAAAAGPIGEAVAAVQAHINWQLTHLYVTPERYPTPRNRRFRRSLRVLEDAVFGMIEARRAERASGRQSVPEGDDVLSLLLEVQEQDDAAGITDLLLRDEVMTIFMAGHETTANALAWAWYYLAANPEVEERLYAEINSVLGGRLPALADLQRLPFTRMVFEETLRLRPPVWLLGRFPLDDDEASGFRIPAHSSVFLSPYVTHRHPEFWPNPESFDPERFTAEQSAGRPRHAYFPFGAGPRMCIGSEFAMIEGIVCLAVLASRFRLRLQSDREPQLEPLITLRPKGGLPMGLDRRPGV